MRFFNWMSPSFRFFEFDSNKYIVRKFPRHGTYSMNVQGKRKEGYPFVWKEAYQMVLDTKPKFDK